MDISSIVSEANDLIHNKIRSLAPKVYNDSLSLQANSQLASCKTNKDRMSLYNDMGLDNVSKAMLTAMPKRYSIKVNSPLY